MSSFLFPQFCVLQFSKSPHLGKVKTRLAPALTEEQRNILHSKMTQWVCSQVNASKLAEHQLWVDGDLNHPLFTELCEQYGLNCFQQEGESLGQKMFAALSKNIQVFQGVFLIGSDCPFLLPEFLLSAMKALQDSDAVIAPACDGGYVLLGLKTAPISVFSDMPWGGPQVCELSLQRLKSLQLKVVELPTLTDIDRPEDLRSLSTEGLPEELRAFSAFGKN